MDGGRPGGDLLAEGGGDHLRILHGDAAFGEHTDKFAHLQRVHRLSGEPFEQTLPIRFQEARLHIEDAERADALPTLGDQGRSGVEA